MISRLEELLSDTQSIDFYFDKLWPICRSITGKGFRDSLQILKKIVPFKDLEFKTGMKVFDWVVPEEWNIQDAWIKDAKGKKIVDFKNSNLHVINYSQPINETMTLQELEPHLYSLPDQPNAIPYLTSYYKKHWGFCVTHKQKLEILKLGKKTKFHVFIDSTHSKGKLVVGEVVLPASKKTAKEVLISSYLCHPSMANNELSGPLVLCFLYDALKKVKQRKYNYRFVVVPETIGSISYLSKVGKVLKTNCIGGMVLTCVGDSRKFTYKRSKQGDTEFDEIFAHEMTVHAKQAKSSFEVKNFYPWGSDERQYCSPGFNLPIGSFMRSAPGDFSEYHTSLDNKQVVSAEAIRESVYVCLKALLAFEKQGRFLNTVFNCEPMLGSRGLYSMLGSQKKSSASIYTAFWLLSYSDGRYSLLEIAKKSGLSILELEEMVQILIDKKLLKEIKKNGR